MEGLEKLHLSLVLLMIVLIYHILQLLGWTSDAKCLTMKAKMSNCNYGIQLASKDLEILLRLTIEEQQALY